MSMRSGQCKFCGDYHDNPREACWVHNCLGCGDEIHNLSDALYCETCVNEIVNTLEFTKAGMWQVYRLYTDGSDKTRREIDSIFLSLFSKTFKDMLKENTRNIKIKKFAETFWTVADVKELAQFNDIKLTDKQMGDFLDEIQGKILDFMIQAGWHTLEYSFKEKFMSGKAGQS